MDKSISEGLDAADTETSMIERAPVPQEQMVPDLLKVSPMTTSTATDVETSITEPVVISDSFCRFVLLNKGILHSHSKITLAVTKPDDLDRFYAPNVGVASLIKRCALKVGTKTLQEIDGYNYFTAYKSMFINNEHQLEREYVQVVLLPTSLDMTIYGVVMEEQRMIPEHLPMVFQLVKNISNLRTRRRMFVSRSLLR